MNKYEVLKMEQKLKSYWMLSAESC